LIIRIEFFLNYVFVQQNVPVIACTTSQNRALRVKSAVSKLAKKFTNQLHTTCKTR